MNEETDKVQLPDHKEIFTRELGNDFLSALMDVRFQTSVAVKMLPVIYVVLIGGLIALSVSTVVAAFGRDLWQGLFHLLIIVPTYLVAGVVLIRVGLELVVAIFRIAAHVEELSGWSQDLFGLEGLREALRSLLPARDDKQ